MELYVVNYRITTNLCGNLIIFVYIAQEKVTIDPLIDFDIIAKTTTKIFQITFCAIIQN